MKISPLVIFACCVAFNAALSPASAATGYWIPYAAPTKGALYVIPSDNLSATPALAGSYESALTAVSQITVSKTDSVTADSPFAMIYLAAGADGKTHVYALDLTDLAAVPKPKQLSSLALQPPAAICSLLNTQMATDALDPSTAFVLIHTNKNGASSCNMSGDVYQVVRYSDASTTAPTVVDISIKPFDGSSALPGIATPIYQASGALGGIVLVNAAGDLLFYAGDAFTGPAVLTTGVTSMMPIYYGSPQTPSSMADVGYFVISKGSKQSLWRVGASGGAVNTYSFQGMIGSFTTDGGNSHLFFFDNVTVADSGGGGTGTTTQHLYQESLSGGAPLHLYTAPAVVSNSETIGQLGLALIGSDGTMVVMESVQSPLKTTFASSVVTIAVGKASAPKTIAGPFAGVDSLQAMTCAQTFGAPLEDVLINVTEDTSKGNISYSSEAITIGGDIIQEQLANSLFVSAIAKTVDTVPQCPSNAGLIAQVRGITATDGSYGGGSMVALNLHGDLIPPLPAVTPLLTSSGKEYIIANTDSVGGSAVFSSSGSVASGYVGVGALPLPPGPDGLAIDFSKNEIAVFGVTGSDLQPLF